uniref:Transporter n=1 Tax=Romanomermis culicivorax TaxID=13658 RepID=A0A915L9S8_ROMCU
RKKHPTSKSYGSTTNPDIYEPKIIDVGKHVAKISPQAMEQALPEREKWGSIFEFFLSCIGYAVGLGNIWRFPYLCYDNGGGAFFVPYLLSLLLCGVPMFVLETSWGQLLSIGGLGMWKLCPILKGVGIAAVVVAFWLNIYYIVVLAWGIFYFYHSFSQPWASCNQTWNSMKCRSEYDKCSWLNETKKTFNLQGVSDQKLLTFNSSYLPAKYKLCELSKNYTSPFCTRLNALSITQGIDIPGELKWDLALCLFIAWVLCYLAIFKGVGWTGKVVYFTAIFPYILLFILFFRGVTLDGAIDGIQYYIYPRMSILTSAEVWKKAVTQIFFTYGLALGALVALGSYNPYHNNIVKQAFSICLIDSGTSIFAGFVVFSFIGYMAKKQDQLVEDVAKAGPGLLFVAYPSGIMTLEFSKFWSVLFFFMVILIGIDSQFCTMEGFFTAIIDEFPQYLRKKHAREIFVAVVCFVSYLIGLSMVTEGGMWVFQIFDDYGASGWCLLWLLFFECIAISWLYGVDRWFDHLEDMIGHRPSAWWKFCWVWACPLCCVGVFIFSLLDYSGSKYNNQKLPGWADGVGWIMALSSMLCVPIYAFWLWRRTPGDFVQKYKLLICPDVSVVELRQAALKHKVTDQTELTASTESSALMANKRTTAINPPKMIFKQCSCQQNSALNLVTFPDKLWHQRRVPYILDDNLTDKERWAVAQAFDEYKEKTCIKFVPKEAGEADFVHIKKNDNAGLHFKSFIEMSQIFSIL